MDNPTPAEENLTNLTEDEYQDSLNARREPLEIPELSPEEMAAIEEIFPEDDLDLTFDFCGDR